MSVSALSATDDQNVAATCELLVGSPPARVNPHPPPKTNPSPHASTQPQPRPTHRSLYSRHMSSMWCINTERHVPGGRREDTLSLPCGIPLPPRRLWKVGSGIYCWWRRAHVCTDCETQKARRKTGYSSSNFVIHRSFYPFLFLGPTYNDFPPPKKTKPNHKAVFSESPLL